MISPAAAPQRLPPFQTMPPNAAGAICPIAAKARKPVAARELNSAMVR